MPGQLPSIEHTGDNHFVITGELNMQTVPELARRAHNLLTEVSGDLSVDLSGVSRVDSSALALLIDLQRLTRRQHSTIHFQHLPGQLEQILRLSELHEILPI